MRIAMERGVSLGGGGDISTDGFAEDSPILAELERINRQFIAFGQDDPEVLRESGKRIAEMEGVPEGERNIALNRIHKALINAQDRMRERARTERFGFYLQEQDLGLLGLDPIRWLDNQFDDLYRLAQEGQELTSPIINNMQTVAAEAIRFLQYNNPNKLDEFQSLFTIRFNLIQMRTTIGYRSIQSIQEASYRLGAHGLLYGLGLEKGKVGMMFSRMQEYLEDKRLSAGGTAAHITPQMIDEFQAEMIKKQIDLAERGVGPFVNDVLEKDVENEWGRLSPEEKARIVKENIRKKKINSDIV